MDVNRPKLTIEFYLAEVVKRIFAIVKPRFTSAKLNIQYNYLHSNAILNIKM